MSLDYAVRYVHCIHRREAAKTLKARNILQAEA